MDYKKKKKPWKNLNLSKAIKKIFTGFKSFSLNPSTPPILSKPKFSQYECPCGYHSRQREQHRRHEVANSPQRHHKMAENKIHVHGGELRRGNNNTGILVITQYEYKDYKDDINGENGLSMDDAYALVSHQSRNGAAAVKELDDVDERAEKFIKEFREQLRIQTVLSSEKEYI